MPLDEKSKFVESTSNSGGCSMVITKLRYFWTHIPTTFSEGKYKIYNTCTMNVIAILGLVRKSDLKYIFILLIAGIFRHCGGFSWGYNQNAYFDAKTDSNDYLLVLTVAPVVSGLIGTTTGGGLTGFI